MKYVNIFSIMNCMIIALFKAFIKKIVEQVCCFEIKKNNINKIVIYLQREYECFFYRPVANDNKLIIIFIILYKMLFIDI